MHTGQAAPICEAITHLLKEHEHVYAQLGVLSNNAAQIVEGGPLELDLMLEALQDLLEYVDFIHRPREDAALGLIASRMGTPPNAVVEIERQHERLQERGERLLDHLTRVAADVPVSRHEIQEDLVAFMNEMRGHMTLEETAIFPLAERVLTPSDWERIESMRVPRRR